MPLWAGLTGRIAGGWPDTLQLMLLRFPSVLAVGAVVLLTGLIAAEFGGNRRPQVLAALTMAVGPVIVFAGHLLSTTTFDILVWTTLAWLLARWLGPRPPAPAAARGRRRRRAAGSRTFRSSTAPASSRGLLIAGPREVFRRWQLWVGGLIALAIWAPNLYVAATTAGPRSR